MKHLLFSLPLLLLGCTSSNLNKDYIAADAETYSVVAPQVEKWLSHEPGLTLQDPEDVHDWNVKLRSWKFRITEAERLLAEQEED